MMYDTDQCHTRFNSLRLFVFPYGALRGLFGWNCALRVYRLSYLGYIYYIYHVSAQGIDERISDKCTLLLLNLREDMHGRAATNLDCTGSPSMNEEHSSKHWTGKQSISKQKTTTTKNR